MPIYVMIFDDNLQRRQSLELLLNMNEQFVCCGSFENGVNASSHVRHVNPDVVLMDIDMPIVNGIEAVKYIRGDSLNVPILMQTVFDEDDKVFNSILAGADGYLLKNTRSEELLQAIKDAHEGSSPVTPSIAKKVLNHFRSNTVKAVHDYGLTQREKEILTELVSGKSYKMVADVFNISIYTVNDHIKKIYKKLHVHNAAEAVNKALKEKLL